MSASPPHKRRARPLHRDYMTLARCPEAPSWDGDDGDEDEGVRNRLGAKLHVRTRRNVE